MISPAGTVSPPILQRAGAGLLHVLLPIFRTRITVSGCADSNRVCVIIIYPYLKKNILTVTLREGVSQEDLAGQVLAQTLPCDGVFCVNDLLAAGAAKILKLKNPNSTVIVTGYDNIYGHLSSEYGFTTMSVDFVRMGETALNYLTGSVSGPRIIRIEPQIIIKENNQN